MHRHRFLAAFPLVLVSLTTGAGQTPPHRGKGTWRSTGPSQIEFGPLALTRAQCPPGSLHDQIVRQWENIRSYVLRHGHLFLALKIDGGIYEFEPVAKPK